MPASGHPAQAQALIKGEGSLTVLQRRTVWTQVHQNIGGDPARAKERSRL